MPCLDEAVIRPFVKIDLVVAQLAQKGQIAGPVLIRILISREPASGARADEFEGTDDRHGHGRAHAPAQIGVLEDHSKIW